MAKRKRKAPVLPLTADRCDALIEALTMAHQSTQVQVRDLNKVPHRTREEDFHLQYLRDELSMYSALRTELTEAAEQLQEDS